MILAIFYLVVCNIGLYGAQMKIPAIYFCATALLTSMSVSAQHDAQSQQQHKGKGQVQSSGKFVPNAAEKVGMKEEVTPTEARDGLQKSLKVEPMGGERFRIGKVVLDKKKNTVTIPVKVNMTQGVLEYALVHDNGKAHESLFTTSAKPSNIHLACVLLGKTEVAGREWPRSHDGITKDQSVKVEVTWPTNGPVKLYPLSKLVLKTDQPGESASGKELAAGDWLYSGSHFRGSVFMAESEGSIISIIGDGAALVNGLRVGHDNDLLHTANSALLPAQGRTLKMVFTLPKKAVKKP